MSMFSMGKKTFELDVRAVFGANRAKLMEQLPSEVLVCLKGGPSETRFDSDHEPIFRQESYFFWLTGVKEPDCAVLLERDRTTLFAPRLPASYATVMGKIRTLDEWKDLYCVDDARYLDELEEIVLEKLETENGRVPKTLLMMKGLNSDSGKMYEPPVFESAKLNALADTETLFPILAECRVIKSKVELQLLQFATEITSWAHAYVMRNFRAGDYEYQAESLFRHYCYYNYGARLVGYTPICGCGPDAAVLHYGHAGEPNQRQSTSESMCLMDMGAEYFCYGSDVTCSWPASGKFSAAQKIIYMAVYRAQVAVYETMRPGVSYVDCHKAAEAAILNDLAAAGIIDMRDKTVEELVELRLGAVFMPHGLGHFIGIDTHDVGGYLAGHPERIESPGLKSLRTARVLQADMVMTVEPGCYFIDHLLDEALDDASPLQRFLVAEKISSYRGFGGVRLEDVVQVTNDGIKNYTLCPRTVEEVESTMAGSKWPPVKDTAPELRRVRLTDPTPLPSPPSI